MIDKKWVTTLFAVLLVSGCAVNYTYEDKKYDNKEAFHQAVDSKNLSILGGITPLPTPLTQRKIIIAMPSDTAMIEAATARFVKAQNTQPMGPAKEILENLPRSTYKNIKIFADAVQKRNIFASVQFIAMPEMTGTFAASSDTDTLVMVEPNANSAQWFYTSQKHGKQIFSYDRSSPTAEGKVQAFLEAVQALAIRD